MVQARNSLTPSYWPDPKARLSSSLTGRPRDLALDIMGEFARAGPGEIHAVVGAQLSDLAFEVGTLLQEAAGLVDKSVPPS
jgi:hypothetical protein